MSPSRPAIGPASAGPVGGAWIQGLLLSALAVAPLAIGSIHPAAYVPLLAVLYLTGVASWFRGRVARALGTDSPPPPGWKVLLGLHGVVAIQLIPLPPAVLGWLSPGSYAVCCIPPPGPQAPWSPVSVYPAETLRGAAFLGGMSLLYATVFRDFRQEVWRRRLCATVVGVGILLTVAALLQEASSEPRKIYGLLRPRVDWAVFGPYVNRNHFAGYLAVAVPLGLAFAVEALGEASRRMRRRPFWRALGEHEASLVARRAVVALVPLVGLLASQSRGGVAALAASIVAFLLMLRRRWLALAAISLIAVTGLHLVDLSATFRAFETRGMNRLAAWANMLELVRYFPVLGVGLNAFGFAFRPYQKVDLKSWYGEAHNEYLQILLDTGMVGLGLCLILLARLLASGRSQTGRDSLTAGIFGAVAASLAHALVDFNWQIPANGATFVALAGLAMARTPGERILRRDRRPRGPC